MTIDEMLATNPTIPENGSRILLKDIFEKEEWRCYASEICDESEELAERFLRYHAKIPGFISKEIHARNNPVAIFFFANRDNTHSVKGSLYVNGAVVVAHEPNKDRAVSLFIDDAAAQRLAYPNKGYVYMLDVNEENTP